MADSGLANMMRLERLPFLKDHIQVHYEGSIDKQGGNADWDWQLYQEGDEWVLFDVEGPGCIYNFVQHRYPDSEEPVFRFYFDGSAEPQFEIRPPEFGKKAPFIEPLAAIYQGPHDNGRGPIWVIRGFVPMPFRTSCRVTSSVRLEGFDRALGHGGWGHITYHTYPTADGVETFTADMDVSELAALWERTGRDPKPTDGNETETGARSVAPGESCVIYDRRGAESIASIHLNVLRCTRPQRQDLRIRIWWDDEPEPSVDLPLGAFFGNEFGVTDTKYLLLGSTKTGDFYSYFPMPYWESARIEVVNEGPERAADLSWRIARRPTDAMAYPKDECGYFRASAYYPETLVTPGRDTTIGEVPGRGHVVGGLVTGTSENEQYVSCEGDVRIYFDGIRTPQIESDGSESWACYGWGFPRQSETNPTSGYDRQTGPLCAFSMLRLCTGDWYPFQRGVRFDIEAGGANDWPMRHSGCFYYYGVDAPGLELTDEINVGDAGSEEAHDYAVEGQTWEGELVARYEDDVSTEATDTGRAFTGASAFTVTIRPDNDGVRLRRRSDQQFGRQRARVYVDGKEVVERAWYVADRNPHRRWLDDEFQIPASYTRGKDAVRIRIEFAPRDYVPPADPAAAEAFPVAPAWTEFRYWVYS